MKLTHLKRGLPALLMIAPLSLTATLVPRGAARAQAAEAPAPTPEQALLDKLGKGRRVLIGLGNDATPDPAAAPSYNLGTPIDIHYLYLSGLPGEPDAWTSWNEGRYVTVQAEAAKGRGVIPMFTLYQAAARGDGNLTVLSDAAFMTKYWQGVRKMVTEVGALDVPAILHYEPDLWGYAQKSGGDDPAAIRVEVTGHAAECADLTNDVAGLGKCLVRLTRQYAPKAVTALQSSTFGAADATGRTDPSRIAAYLDKVGGAESDLVVLETLDRDAGCYEVGADPNCKRTGSFYWDEAQFHEHLDWARVIHERTGKPLLWWQMPLGVPSGTPGTSGSYRDNRVQYFFSHPVEFAGAGGVGAVFGTGAPRQTTVLTDGGQFRSALTTYNAAPTPK